MVCDDKKIVLFDDGFKNDKTMRWSIIYICISFIKRYSFSVMSGRSTMGVPMDSLRRGRIVGLMIVPRRGWCCLRFNHDEEGKVEMLRCRRVAIQANTSVGPKNGISMFLLYKTIHMSFSKSCSICIKLLLNNTGGLMSCLDSISLRR